MKEVLRDGVSRLGGSGYRAGGPWGGEECPYSPLCRLTQAASWLSQGPFLARFPPRLQIPETREQDKQEEVVKAEC